MNTRMNFQPSFCGMTWLRRVCLLLFAGLALTAAILAGEQMPRKLVASGGGLSVSSGYRLQSAIGQPVAGLSYTSSYRYCAGYWCGDARDKLYLPLVRK